MLDSIHLHDILFLDIETVPQTYRYEDLDERQRYLWDAKVKYQVNEHTTTAQLYEKAGIMAEFGKVICIGTGVVTRTQGRNRLRVKTFNGSDEKEVLTEFAALLNHYFTKPGNYLCAHNGKEFDFPYLCRRMLLHGISLPDILNVPGKKPWETRFLDTMELWKFGDYKHFTSLELLAGIFGIPTPKDDIKGEDVKRVYYEENDLDRIVRYCRKDVVTLVQLFLKYRCQPLVSEEDITFV